MLVHDLPGAADPSINVGNPHREIDRLVLRVGAAGMEDRVTVTEHLVSDDAQLAELTLHGPFKKGKKLLPVFAVSLGTDVLPWWKRIKNEKALARHICLHDGSYILGTATRNKLFVNSSYLLFIGGLSLFPYFTWPDWRTGTVFD
jgi:hypothetical protein